MPDWSKEIRERLEGLKVTPEREASIVEEIAQHLEDRYADLVAAGSSPDAARRAALDELAVPDLAPALSRALPPSAPSRLPPADEGGGWLSGLAKDFRYGARRLRLEPAFAFVAILSLALGIGANTAIFQLIDAVRLRGLPVADPKALYNVRIAPSRGGRTGNFSGRYPQLTTALWERIGSEQKAFSKLAAWSSDRVNLSPDGEARYAEGLWVSGTFFDTVGVGALRGRVLGSADDTPACAGAAVVVSEPFWRRELGGRDLSRGETLTVEGRRFDIVGVTPARFFGVEVGRSFDVALPLCAENLVSESPRTKNRSGWWIASIGRLAPGWTLEKANAHLAAISKGVFESTLPEDYDAEDAKHFLGFKLTATPAATGFSDLRDRLFRSALAAPRHLGARPAHRLRQHRQPHGRPGERAAAGDRRAARPGRLPRAPHPATARRKSRPRGRRRGLRRGARPGPLPDARDVSLAPGTRRGTSRCPSTSACSASPQASRS